LRTTAFRNLADAVTDIAAKNIFLVGENGQGKTNFLEALYFCAYGSSFRKAHDGEIAQAKMNQAEKKNFSAEIVFSDELRTKNISSEVLVKFSAGKKSVFIDGKKIEDRKDLLSVIPSIVFCHEDMEFVAGSPEQRRRFFDQVLSLYDPVYLDDLRCYRRVVKSRNSVLRAYALRKLNGDPETLLDALDQQCVLYGVKLMEKRETAAHLFSGVFEELYREVSGIAGVNVLYLPSWKGAGEVAADSLRKRRSAEMAAGISLSGPHRDRYLFTQGEEVDCMRRVRTPGMYPRALGHEDNTLPKQPLVDTIEGTTVTEVPLEESEVKTLTVYGFAQARAVMDSIRKGECDVVLVRIKSCTGESC
jgi:DNA replication and repair protein RecF